MCARASKRHSEALALTTGQVPSFNHELQARDPLERRHLLLVIHCQNAVVLLEKVDTQYVQAIIVRGSQVDLRHLAVDADLESGWDGGISR